MFACVLSVTLSEERTKWSICEQASYLSAQTLAVLSYAKSIHALAEAYEYDILAPAEL